MRFIIGWWAFAQGWQGNEIVLMIFPWCGGVWRGERKLAVWLQPYLVPKDPGWC